MSIRGHKELQSKLCFKGQHGLTISRCKDCFKNCNHLSPYSCGLDLWFRRSIGAMIWPIFMGLPYVFRFDWGIICLVQQERPSPKMTTKGIVTYTAAGSLWIDGNFMKFPLHSQVECRISDSFLKLYYVGTTAIFLEGIWSVDLPRQTYSLFILHVVHKKRWISCWILIELTKVM